MFEELNSIKSSRKDFKKFWFYNWFYPINHRCISFFREKDSFVYFFSIGSILIILGGIAPVF